MTVVASIDVALEPEAAREAFAENLASARELDSRLGVGQDD